MPTAGRDENNADGVLEASEPGCMSGEVNSGWSDRSGPSRGEV